jgi:cellulose synthase/poly-beta-1,6-N-acetylglucosamine synthase-like glycosyltransferase
MLAIFEDSLALVQIASPFIALLSVIIFEVPRYLFSTFAMALFNHHTDDKVDYTSTVSVIISSFNGADTLPHIIKSVHAQKANIVDIIIVNDGSTDDTLHVASQLRRDGYATKIIHHDHRIGKSASINHAARFAKGDLLFILDDDTYLPSHYEVARLASIFQDKHTAGASGKIRIGNAHASLWTSLQRLEYLISITAGRSFLNIIDAIACCSGAFSMFRRSVYLDIGGLNVGPGEDLEITQRLRLLGYKVGFVPQAIAITQAPETLSTLVHQRLRWDRDALNIRLFVYKNLWRASAYERVSDIIQWLDFMIFEVFPTFVFPFYIMYIIYYFQNNTLIFLTGIYFYLLALNILNIAVVIISTEGELAAFDGLAIFALPFYQSFIMRLVRIYAFADEMFFAGSRRDDYVPYYIRHVLYQRINHA